MLKNAHILLAKTTLCLVANPVTLCRVVVYRVASTVGLKRAVPTHRDAVGDGFLNGAQEHIVADNLFIRIPVKRP